MKLIAWKQEWSRSHYDEAESEATEQDQHKYERTPRKNLHLCKNNSWPRVEPQLPNQDA